MAATQGKNRAGGFQNSGRGLLALQDTAQKSAAGYYFPYMEALGRPGTGANAYFEAYKYLNPQIWGGGSGGGSRMSSPRVSLSSRQASPGGATPGTPAAATGLPYWENSYGSGMGPMGPLPGYGPSAGAGTGYAMSDYGTTQFTPGGMNYQPAGSEYLPMEDD